MTCLQIRPCSILTTIRRSTRVHLPASALAQRCLLRRRLLSRSLPPDLENCPHPRPQNSPTYGIPLPSPRSPLHLLLPCQLLLNLLLRCGLPRRSHDRSLRPQHRRIHLCRSPLHLRPRHLSPIHPQHGESTPGCKKNVSSIYDHVFNYHDLYDVCGSVYCRDPIEEQRIAENG